MRDFMAKLAKVLKWKNFTNHKFAFLADCAVPFLNKYFDSFDEAREYGNKIQQLNKMPGGYNLYKWHNKEWVCVLRWEELN